MATINGAVGTNSSKYSYYITWTETDIDNVANTSLVTASVYVKKISNYSAEGYGGTHHLYINGVHFSDNNYIDMNPETTPRLVVTGSTTVTHNADGSKSISISANGDLPDGLNGGVYYGPRTGSASATVALTTIPREASITNTPNFVIGASIPITISNPANGYIKAETYVNGVLIKTQTLGQVTSATLTFNSTEIGNMYAQVPNASSIGATIRLKTYTDSGYGTQLGSNSDKAVTATVDPTTNAPTFTQGATPKIENVDKTVVVTDTHGNTLVSSSTETLIGGSSHKNIGIQYISKLRATIAVANKAAAVNSATMSKYRFVNGSQIQEVAYSAVADVTMDIDSVSTNVCNVSAVDSRNLITTLTPTLSVFSLWSWIDVFSAAAERTNSVDPEVTLSFFASYWKKYFSSNTTSDPGYGTLNTIIMAYRYKETTEVWDVSEGTFTVTIASPAVVTKSSHGLSTGDQVYLTTTGALPTGLSANTYYYIIKVDANSFNLATSYANAIAGTKINTSGSQSGTHTLWHQGMWTTITPTSDVAGAVSFADTISGDLGSTGFNVQKSFDIEVRVFDKLSVAQIECTLSKGIPVIDLTKYGAGIMKQHSGAAGKALEIEGDGDVTGDMYKGVVGAFDAIITGWTPVSGSCTYASADAPTFVINVPSGAGSIFSVGMRIKLTQTTIKYFIVTAVTDTTLTVYGGTDYTLANAAISDMYFSSHKAPLGFPMSPDKWTVSVTDTTQRTPTATSTPTAMTGMSVDLPIGAWIPSFGGYFRATRTASGGGIDLWVGITTSTNSFSDNELVSGSVASYLTNGTGTAFITQSGFFKTIVMTSKTTHYLSHKVNTTTSVSILLYNDTVTARMQFLCAYL